jgi:hypothetical protein
MLRVRTLAGYLDNQHQWLPVGSLEEAQALCAPLSYGWNAPMPAGLTAPAKADLKIASAVGEPQRTVVSTASAGLVILDPIPEWRGLPIVAVDTSDESGNGPAWTAQIGTDVEYPEQYPLTPVYGSEVFEIFENLTCLASLVELDSTASHAHPVSVAEELAGLQCWLQHVKLLDGVDALLLRHFSRAAFATGAVNPQFGGLAAEEVDTAKPVGFYLPRRDHGCVKDLPFRLGTNSILMGLAKVGKTTLALREILPAAARANLKIHYVAADEPLQPYALSSELKQLEKELTNGEPILKWWGMGNMFPQTVEMIYAHVAASGAPDDRHIIVFDGARQIEDTKLPGLEPIAKPGGILNITARMLTSISRSVHPRITGLFLWTTIPDARGQESPQTYAQINGHFTTTLWMRSLGNISEGRLRYDNDIFPRETDIAQREMGLV